MGLITRIKDWADREILTEPDLETEFDNVTDGVNTVWDEVGTRAASGANTDITSLTGLAQAGMGYSVFIGEYTGLNDDLSDNKNVFIGYAAGRGNTTGNHNTALGDSALYSNTTGNHNTALGHTALRSNTTGTYNTALGRSAGRYHPNGTTPLTDPENSVYIGANAKGKDNADNNSIVIGYNAVGLGANTVVLGNDNVTATALKGNVQLNGELNVNTHKITGVVDPMANQDAATKKYVDNNSEGVYNVKSYGAIGDGTGNDGPEINNAISAACIAGGGTVIIPPGVYRIETTILLKDNVVLRGSGNAGVGQDGNPATIAGSVIKANVTPAITTLSGSGNCTVNAGLENVALWTDTKTGATDVAIHLRSIQHSVFRQIYIQGWTAGTGIHLQPDDPGAYIHGCVFDDIRMNCYLNIGYSYPETIGVGIKFDGLWNGGTANAGITDNTWRHVQIYWPKTYGIWFRNMCDNERFYYCLIRGSVDNSVLVKYNDTTGENVNITNHVFYDLTLTQKNTISDVEAGGWCADSITAIDFDTSNGEHEFYGLQLAGDAGGWCGTEIDTSGVGALFSLYATGIRGDNTYTWNGSAWVTGTVYPYKMQWQKGNRYNVMNGGNQYWRDTEAGTDLMKLGGSTGNLTVGGCLNVAPASGTACIYAKGKAAADYGELACVSDSAYRARLKANNVNTFLNYTGPLTFRTIAEVPRAVLYSTGNLSLDGTLTENAWSLGKKPLERKWELLDTIQQAYQEHDGRYLDPALRVKFGNKWGKRPSDFIQIAIECIAELKKRIGVLEGK